MNRTAPRFGIPLTVLLPILGALGVLWFLRTALAPFFLAMVLAYLLEPLTARLARRIRRGWAALIAILVLILGAALLFWAIVPLFVAQLERLWTSLPGWQAKAVQQWMPWLSAHPAVLEKWRNALDGVDPMAFLRGLGIAGAGLLGWFLESMTLILVPLIVYYLLVEGPQTQRDLEGLIPVRHRGRVLALVTEVNGQLGGYVRGQLAVALVMSVLQGLAFHLLGVPYAWLLGLVAGISNVVPYSPYITALPLALVMAALDGASGAHLLVQILVFVLVQKAETFYFTPVWVGRATGLHPLEVLLAIFCFGFAFGLVGLIFAVPLMIVTKVLFRALLAHYKASPWFNQASE